MIWSVLLEISIPNCILSSMQWSKLKQTIEGRFAGSVRGRVAIFSTRYNKPNCSDGRAWITIDGKEVVNLSTMESHSIYRCYYHQSTPIDCQTHPAVRAEDRTPGQLVERGEFSRFDLHCCCWEYLQLSVEEGLGHASPLINLLAVLDKRLGKRRLVLIKKEDLHPMVRTFLEFRLEMEGLSIPGG